VDEAGPAIVRILGGPADAGRPATPRGLGFLVDQRGYVLTHSDVIRDAKVLQVVLADGRTLPVKQVWRDELAGVAVLRIDGRDLPTLALGGSGGLRVGDPAVVVGRAIASSEPPVSATIRATGAATGGNLAIDAPIATAYVGSPLIDARGQVVGIASTDAHSMNGSAPGGFAVPIDRAKALLRQAQAQSSVAQVPPPPSFER
jgi:S1-C subfamily serine protease